MFFQSPIIVFLQRGGLVVATQHQPSVRFSYPEGAVSNLEVIDRQGLLSASQTFLEQRNVKGKHIMLVLDYSVVFEKTIELDKTGQPDKLLQGFVDAMPFETGKRACLGSENGSKLRLYATNAELYDTIATALRAAGASNVIAITPIAAYNLPEGERTVTAATTRILKDTAVSKQVNFRDTNPT